MVNLEFISILRLVNELLSTRDIDWAITGSTSFALQGLPFKPDDIDIQTNQQGAYEIESLFKNYIRRPVVYSSNGFIRSHFGELVITGISIEIIGDIEKFVDGVWEKAPNLNEIKKFINVANLKLPVLSLEYEVEAYRKLGREDKAATLFKHLSNLDR
ncbi:nucleotidyltransferase domain-containing protein [Paenibacillus eucommiae]|uniref:Nucleotidyltransferase n=1 Tax=Paenibacillus eucommiae TaxID=1355755 RepID=A0ABS4JAR0_9BACL|nr:hypothetical protein [Paenibacillus eucommiae]MBP1996934.1 hypothetical protein [Paenibacillus eucommiae]